MGIGDAFLEIRGDAIECPYHGLRFDRTGQCVHNPHGDGRIPSAARVTRYSSFCTRKRSGASACVNDMPFRVFSY